MGAVGGSTAVVVILHGDTEVVIGEVVIGEVVAGEVVAGCPDLALVDALARLQLAARRLGLSIRLRDPWEGLAELLDLVGLAGLLLEPDREAERREQLGVEEVVPAADPPA